MAPKNRNKKNQRLPKYVYLSNGRYILRPYLGCRNGKPVFGTDIRLCGADASITEVWRAYDNATKSERQTLSWLINQYLKSEKFRTRSPKTQEEYERYSRQLIEFKTATGAPFGDFDLDTIDRKVIRLYLDKADSPVAANRRIQYLKAVYSWAIQRLDGVEENPCVGVDLNAEKSRTRYVEDWEYEVMFMCAMESPYPYVAMMMELAYLCRQRRNEVASRRATEITETGLITYRGKGSKGELTRWSERLRAAVDACLSYNKDAPTPLKPDDRYLIHDKWGRPIKKNAFDTAWQRVRDKAMTTGSNNKVLTESFTFHDIKAKGISDHVEQDGGHMTEKARQIYIRKLKEQVSTR